MPNNLITSMTRMIRLPYFINAVFICFRIDSFLLFFCLLLIAQPIQATLPLTTLVKPVQEKPQEKVEKINLPVAPDDEYNRGTPRSSVKGYLKAANQGDLETAAEYLDLRNLPHGLKKTDGPMLAKKLKIVLDRTLWVDLDLVSEHPKGHLNDGLPAYRDSLGKIKAGKKTISILLQHVPRKDGVLIWKFSNRTVGSVPLLYEYQGYSPLEEYLEGVFPDIQVFGWHTWQWASYCVLIILSFLLAFLPTLILSIFLKRSKTEFREECARYISGPVRIIFWILFSRASIELLGPSDQIRALHHAGILLYFIATWAMVRLIDLGGFWFAELLKRKERHATQVLLKPIKTVFKVIIIFTGLLLWLDNLGVQVSTLLASLGIGGLAFALAAQDMLKNLLGSVMILIDRPYEIGQRILVKGHDGIVEEIGLRSTKIRLLNGHQATIPNEEMAKVDIENIGRRPHIRRTANIAIPLNTPVEKITRAVEIIKQNLEDHECMHASFPPRVYFNEFNRDSVNIQIFFWYRSSDYWAFQAFNERLNLKIMQDFEAEGIKFALPSYSAYPAGEESASIQPQA